MSVNLQHQLYIENSIALAKSITIKFHRIGEQINQEIMVQYGQGSVNLEDLTTWKYYLNLSGQYHFSDEIIKIKSLDTDELIAFTIENINDESHLITKNTYVYGSVAYNELLEKYPNQSILINGIIDQRNINDIIAADDLSIIGYDAALVEEYEIDLMKDLQDSLYGYFKRWSGYNFSLINDHLIAAQLLQIYSFIIKSILSIRLKNSMNYMVHSFFIKSKLASSLSLDEFYPYLNRSQLLFLYANLNYLTHNAGKQENLIYIIKNLLNNTGLDAYSISVDHNNDNMILDGEVISHDPEIRFKKTSILNSTQSLTTYPLSYIISLIENETPNNADYLKYATQYENQRMIDAPISKLTTKLIMIEPTLTNVENDYAMSEEAFKHWIYVTKENKYNNNIEIKVSEEVIGLNNLNAFRLFIYLSAKLNGITLETMPEFKLVNIYNKSSKQNILNLISNKIVTSDEIDYTMQMHPTIIYPLSGVNSFNAAVKQIDKSKKISRQAIRQMSSWDRRALMQTAINSNYHCFYYEENTEFNYSNFLSQFDIDFDALTEIEMINAIKDIFTTSTGFIFTNSESEIENINVMKNILKRLLSYGIIIVTQYSTKRYTEVDVQYVLSKAYPSTISFSSNMSGNQIYPKNNYYNVSIDIGYSNALHISENQMGIYPMNSSDILDAYQYSLTGNVLYPRCDKPITTTVTGWIDYILLEEKYDLTTGHLEGQSANIGGVGNYWKNLYHENLNDYYINSTVPCYNFKVTRSQYGGHIYTEPNYDAVGLGGVKIGHLLIQGRLNFNRGTRVTGNYTGIIQYSSDAIVNYNGTTNIPLTIAVALSYSAVMMTPTGTGADYQERIISGVTVFEFNITTTATTSTITPTIWCNLTSTSTMTGIVNCFDYTRSEWDNRQKGYQRYITLPNVVINKNIGSSAYPLDHIMTISCIDGIYEFTIDGSTILVRDSDIIPLPLRAIAKVPENEIGYYISSPYNHDMIQFKQKQDTSVVVLQEDFTTFNVTDLHGRICPNAKTTNNQWKKVSTLVSGAASDTGLSTTSIGLIPNDIAAYNPIYPYICYGLKAKENYEISCLFQLATSAPPSGSGGNYLEIYTEFAEHGGAGNNIVAGKYSSFVIRVDTRNPDPNTSPTYAMLGIICVPYSSSVDSRTTEIWSAVDTANGGIVTGSLHHLKIKVTSGKIYATLNDTLLQCEAYIGADQSPVPATIPTSSVLKSKTITHSTLTYEPYAGIDDIRNYSNTGRGGFIGLKTNSTTNSYMIVKSLKVTNFYSKDY